MFTKFVYKLLTCGGACVDVSYLILLVEDKTLKQQIIYLFLYSVLFCQTCKQLSNFSGLKLIISKSETVGLAVLKGVKVTVCVVLNILT